MVASAECPRRIRRCNRRRIVINYAWPAPPSRRPAGSAGWRCPARARLVTPANVRLPPGALVTLGTAAGERRRRQHPGRLTATRLRVRGVTGPAGTARPQRSGWKERQYEVSPRSAHTVAAAADRVLLALPEAGDLCAAGLAGRHRRRGDHPADPARHRQQRDPVAPPADLARRDRAGHRGAGGLRRRVHQALPRGPDVAGRAARSAHRDVRLAVQAGRRTPGSAAHRAGRQPVHLRRQHDPGPARDGAVPARQHLAVLPVPDRDGGSLAAAHRRRRRGRSGPVRDLARLAEQALPGKLGCPAARRQRGRSRGRRGHGSPRRQGLRPGGAGDRAARMGRSPAVRRQGARGQADGQVQPVAAGHPGARPGRSARPRRLARHPRRDQPRHVLRFLVLHRPAGRPGPLPDRADHAGSTGARQRHPGVRGDRLAAGAVREAGRRQAARRGRRGGTR